MGERDAKMEATCRTCEKWTALTWDQHDIRMRNMREMPYVLPHPCPSCGGTFWASKPPSQPRAKDEAAMDWMSIGISACMVVILLIAVILLITSTARAQTTFRDASGRMTGTASTGSNGTTTFRDSSGRQLGTATRSGGTTTYRDGSGRMTGTAERRR